MVMVAGGLRAALIRTLRAGNGGALFFQGLLQDSDWMPSVATVS